MTHTDDLKNGAAWGSLTLIVNEILNNGDYGHSYVTLICYMTCDVTLILIGCIVEILIWIAQILGCGNEIGCPAKQSKYNNKKYNQNCTSSF
jgi:hypothetical protein